MPIITPSGGGGSAFNGGTVTQELDINLAADGEGLRVALLNASGLDVSVGASGLLSYVPDPSSNTQFQVRADGSFNMDNAAGDTVLAYEPGPDFLDLDPLTGQLLVPTGKGFLRFGTTAEPADADIPNNNFAIWLDTGGSALKVKAKWGGTYKTGSIALA